MNMKKNLEYRTEKLVPYVGKVAPTRGLYEMNMPLDDYLPSAKPCSLEAAYSQAMFALNQYVNSIKKVNKYSSPAKDPYLASVESRKGSNLQDSKLGCPRCIEEIDAFGVCQTCGWNPHEVKNGKKGNLYE